MSDTHPVYVACAGGNNAQMDCLVAPHGSLVRLLGHAQMDFTGRDAYAIAKAILAAIDPIDRPMPTPEEKPPKTAAGSARSLVFLRVMRMDYQCRECGGAWSIDDGRSYGGYFCPHCGSWAEIGN